MAMTTRLGGLLLLLSLTLAGCTRIAPGPAGGTAPSSEAPAGAAAPSPGGGDNQVPRVEQGTSRAVLSLLAAAKRRVDAHDLEGAGADLERALRIDPRNGVIWHYLARLRLNQGRLKEAASLAAKSNTLAGHNAQLRRDNWRLIAFVRRSQGDEAGARRAEARAAQYR